VPTIIYQAYVKMKKITEDSPKIQWGYPSHHPFLDGDFPFSGNPQWCYSSSLRVLKIPLIHLIKGEAGPSLI
jgi:hypothetical protein